MQSGLNGGTDRCSQGDFLCRPVLQKGKVSTLDSGSSPLTCKQEAHFVPALEALTPLAVTWDSTTHALEGERVKSFVL